MENNKAADTAMNTNTNMNMSASAKMKLYGFNNLTKSLSFNIYDVCYAKTAREQRDYIAYIDEQYNSERLTNILYRVTEMIGANVINVSKQDYEPQGASVTFLIAEESMIPSPAAADSAVAYRNAVTAHGDPSVAHGNSSVVHGDHAAAHGDAVVARGDHAAARGDTVVARGDHAAARGDTVVAHLDKSHVTVHTYPEYHPDNAIATFRVDIDVATCGEITPLSTLDFLIGSFDSDIITMDYRVRGFTRDMSGKKLFIDHNITSIQDYIDDSVLERYDAIDINVYQSNMFHTKMLIKEVDLQNYLFNADVYEIAPKTRLKITNSLRQEMIEIFSGTNVY